ncbi:hypothetical protein DID80_07335 [Candidatus Marinamargulisbacteria bacterium SCGC AAA071-K20]|nr:hypothetical protein DID80_07335 [Candidatus Marinamargulisbacteria bacterium SCGC AAA071-K20]
MPYAIDIPTLWDGKLLGNKPPDSFTDGVIHPDWIIGGIDGGGGGGGGVSTDEDVRAIVKLMVEGNTESGIVVDTSGSPLLLDFNVNDPTITLTGDITGAGTMTNLANVIIGTTLGTVPLSKGGTGATNQADALTNLGLTGLSPYSQGGSSGIKVDGDFWITGKLYFEDGLQAGSPSDLRFKKSIQNIPDVVEKLSALRGVYYYWRQSEFPDKNFADTRQIGVIAQEVEEVFPELVGHDSQGYKRVNYMFLSAILIEGFNQQQAKIDTLEARLQALEDKL